MTSGAVEARRSKRSVFSSTSGRVYGHCADARNESGENGNEKAERLTRRLVSIRSCLAMINEDCSDRGCCVTGIADEAIRGIRVGACLPDVVWCRARDDNRGSLGLEELGCVDEVRLVGEDRLLGAAA